MVGQPSEESRGKHECKDWWRDQAAKKTGRNAPVCMSSPRHDWAFQMAKFWFCRREINRHNKKVRQNLLQELRGISWQEFEDLVAEKILEALGFKRESIKVTPYQKDGGIDARGILEACDGVVEIKMAVQVKRWKSNQKIQAPDVQKLRGSLATGERGMIITTSDFTSGARKEAVRESATPIALMTGEALVSHLIANEIGVKKHSLEDWIELDKEGLRLKASLEADTDE